MITEQKRNFYSLTHLRLKYHLLLFLKNKKHYRLHFQMGKLHSQRNLGDWIVYTVVISAFLLLLLASLANHMLLSPGWGRYYTTSIIAI